MYAPAERQPLLEYAMTWSCTENCCDPLSMKRERCKVCADPGGDGGCKACYGEWDPAERCNECREGWWKEVKADSTEECNSVRVPGRACTDPTTAAPREDMCASGVCMGGVCCSADVVVSRCNECSDGTDGIKGTCVECALGYAGSFCTACDPNGYYMGKDDAGDDRCLPKEPGGAECVDDTWCASGHCKSFKCCASRELGAVCDACTADGGACASCTGVGRIEPTLDCDACRPGYYKYATGAGECIPQKEVGEICAGDAQCFGSDGTDGQCGEMHCCNPSVRNNNPMCVGCHAAMNQGMCKRCQEGYTVDPDDEYLCKKDCALAEGGVKYHGELKERKRYQSGTTPRGTECAFEIQTSTCEDGSFTDWTGTFEFTDCASDCVGLQHGYFRTRAMYEQVSVPKDAVACNEQKQFQFCNNGVTMKWCSFPGQSYSIKVMSNSVDVTVYPRVTKGLLDPPGLNDWGDMWTGFKYKKAYRDAYGFTDPLSLCVPGWSTPNNMGHTEIFSNFQCSVECSPGCTASMRDSDSCDAECETEKCCFNYGACTRAYRKQMLAARWSAITGDLASAVPALQGMCDDMFLHDIGSPEAPFLSKDSKTVLNEACELLRLLKSGRDFFGNAQNYVTPLKWEEYEQVIRHYLAELTVIEDRLGEQTIIEQAAKNFNMLRDKLVLLQLGQDDINRNINDLDMSQAANFNLLQDQLAQMSNEQKKQFQELSRRFDEVQLGQEDSALQLQSNFDQLSAQEQKNFELLQQKIDEQTSIIKNDLAQMEGNILAGQDELSDQIDDNGQQLEDIQTDLSEMQKLLLANHDMLAQVRQSNQCMPFEQATFAQFCLSEKFAVCSTYLSLRG